MDIWNPVSVLALIVSGVALFLAGRVHVLQHKVLKRETEDIKLYDVVQTDDGSTYRLLNDTDHEISSAVFSPVRGSYEIPIHPSAMKWGKSALASVYVRNNTYGNQPDTLRASYFLATRFHTRRKSQVIRLHKARLID